MQDIIGIGGIIATIIVGIISCVVTWIVAKKSQKVMKFLWYAKASKVLNTSSEFEKGKMQFWYEGNMINNPYIMQIIIRNSGNKSISSAIIKIRINSAERLIPIGFMNILYGYEDKWKHNIINEKECEITLEHINPKQEFTSVFLVEGEEEKISVSCPMEDVSIKESEWLGEEISKKELIEIALGLIGSIVLAVIGIVFIIKSFAFVF